MADDGPASRTLPTAQTAWATVVRFIGGLSLSRVQAFVATLAGIASITAAVFSLTQFAGPVAKGELVALVQTAGSHRPVAGATVEILTTQDALVATLTPDATGVAKQHLKEGVYVVRVSHPRYAAETRRVQVQPRQTTEVRTNLHAGSSSPLERTINKGVNAVRNAFRF